MANLTFKYFISWQILKALDDSIQVNMIVLKGDQNKLLFFFFLKFLLNLLQYCLCFMPWLLDHEACGIPAPRQGIKPAHPVLEGRVSTTGQPGKSRSYF